MDSVTRSGSAKLLPVLHTNNNNNNKKALGTRLTDENMPTNPNRPLNSVRSEISQTQCATVHEQNRTENTDINKAIDIEVDQSNTPEDIMPILDAQHIRTHLPYPTREQYPNAPKSLFANDLRNLGQSFDNSVFRAQRNEVQFTCRTGAPGEPAIWCCTLTLDVPGLGLRSALGEGLRKKVAKNSAWVRLVSIMHSNGELDNIFRTYKAAKSKTAMSKTATSKTTSGFDAQLVSAGSDTIINVYNCTAMYGLVPDHHACLMASTGPQKLRIIRVSVTLPQWGIESSGIAENYDNAEAIAMVDFKTQVEHYHRRTKGRVPQRVVISAQNAKELLTLLKSDRPQTTFEINHELVQFNENRWLAWMLMDGCLVGQGLPRKTKKQAEELMWLSALIHIVQQEPYLLDFFGQYVHKEQAEEGLTDLSIDLNVDRYSELIMRESLTTLEHAGLPGAKEAPAAEIGEQIQRSRPSRILENRAAQNRNEELTKKLHDLVKDSSYAEDKAKLPMTTFRQAIVEMVMKNTYSIVVGSTGSGKTTQVPQILLDDAIKRGVGGHCNIVCTQPRKIAATSVARRVAAERGERLGDTVGYHVRFDARIPRSGGSLLYCTTGILLEQLKHAPDETMDRLSHIVVDEVHERDMLIDFLIINIRNIIQARKKVGKHVPNVVIMSATLDTDLFAKYFGMQVSNEETTPCPAIEVPGRLFPVKEHYLDEIIQDIRRAYSGSSTLLKSCTSVIGDSEMARYLRDEQTFAPAGNIGAESDPKPGSMIDSHHGSSRSSDIDNGKAEAINQGSFVPIELLAATIGYICKSSDSGAILAFLPGLEEIVKTQALLWTSLYGFNFSDSSKFRIHLLHSSVAREAQDEVFKPIPQGCRRIILATNICETSVTLPDLKFVVDTGKLRESRYSQEKRITSLETVWESQSNARQRAGRAGRVQDGVYYALFSKARKSSLRASGLPELLRSDLQGICLAVKAQQFKDPVREFLASAIEPPSSVSVQIAIDELKTLEAITADEQLTPLGRLLSKLPVHPSLGKMIVLGIIFRCLDPILLLGAASEERSIFARPLGEREQANRARKVFSGYASDQISFIRAFNVLRQVRAQYGHSALWDFALSKYLHLGAFKIIEQGAQQIEAVLAEAGLVPSRRSGGEVGNPYNYFGGSKLNANAENYDLIRGLLVAGFHPNLVTKPLDSGHIFRTLKESTVYVHPSSLNRPTTVSPLHRKGSLFTYSALATSGDSKRIFFRESTKVTPLLAILFGGHPRLDGNTIVLDNWLKFCINADDQVRAATVLLDFRKALDRTLGLAFQSLTRQREDELFIADIPLIESFSRDLAELLQYDGQQYDRQQNSFQPATKSTW
ncbi:P-loop containing nucleoside triphosphate hydrolase protein [Delphinella strobiligena]|nr:P-loop containing nucleoside triphosphate hydrolase protein [Delphinella strobiligena]